MILEELFGDVDILVGKRDSLQGNRLIVMAGVLKVLALQRAGDRNFAFRSATDGTNIASYARTKAFGPPHVAKGTSHFFSIEGGRDGQTMSRTNLFFKVEVEHDREENPERIGSEICRQLLKLYGVRAAELANFTRAEE
jgi:hypothetical protein